MTNADATRLSEGNSDATRFAGKSYRTRLAPSAATDVKTRIAQEGYQSKLARDAANDKPDDSEFYKIGDKIGDRYEVSAIHHGAMGVVYGCFDHETKLPRALKTVRSRHLHDKQVLSLFENEAAVWISLEKHPYIVRAYLVERFNKFPYVITEYVRGPEGMEGDLRGWLGHPRLTLPVAVAMALQIAQGMQHAVRKVPNLVHRDLKPANILVSGDGKAMVTDFGLVYATHSGAGTPAYMSPEQWREDALDARSDIYAYGCILFEMFTGHRLFPALTERDWERAHVESTPATLTSIVPELSGEIDRFVRCCLEKDMESRPQSWDEVVIFFAEWYHRLTGKAVVLDFSSLALDVDELNDASFSLWNLGRYQEMLSVCDKALSIDPNSISAMASKGNALGALNFYEEAIDYFDRVLVTNPNWSEVLINKSVLLKCVNRYEEGIQVLDREIMINPNSAKAWNLKGQMLNKLKRFEEEVQAYDQALAIAPNNSEAWRCKGEALRLLNRHKESIHAYSMALDINPNDAHAWLGKGHSLLSLDRYLEALLAYDHASSLDNNGGVSFIKGVTLLKLKRYKESICECDRALSVNPKLTVAQNTKNTALQELKRSEEMTLLSAQNEQLDRQESPKGEVVAPTTKPVIFYVGLIAKIIGKYYLRLVGKTSKQLYLGLIVTAIVIAWIGGGFNKKNNVANIAIAPRQSTVDLATAKSGKEAGEINDLQSNEAAVHISGRTDSEMAEQLAKKEHFDLDGARKAGYTDQQIIKHFSPNGTPDAADTRQDSVGYKGQLDTPAVQQQYLIGRAPNGLSWPANSGYLRGFKKLNAGGLSSLTIDNTHNGSDVHLKLYALDHSPPVAARHVFIKAGDIFTFRNIKAGNYDVRYRDLRNAGISKSEGFKLQEIHENSVTKYSEITLTLYKIQNGNTRMSDISEAEF